MALAKTLTIRLQKERTPKVILRDYPLSSLHPADPDYVEPVCCYCEQRFLEGSVLWYKTWEHLDNDKANELLWNLAWAHWKCNQDKMHDNYDYQVMALDIIRKNKEWEENSEIELSSERESETDTQPHTEIDLNTTHFQIAVEYLAEKIHAKNPNYPIEDAIYSIVTRCRKKTTHGSHQSVRGYLKELCSTENKYETEKIDGKIFIKRRTGQ